MVCCEEYFPFEGKNLEDYVPVRSVMKCPSLGGILEVFLSV